MEITLAPGPLAKTPADVWVILATSDHSGKSTPHPVDRRLHKLIADWRKSTSFKFSAGNAAVLPTWGQLPASYVILVGLGRAKEFNVQELQRASNEPAQKKLTLIVLCKSELFYMGAEGESVMPSKYPSSIAEAKRMAKFYGVEWCEQ